MREGPPPSYSTTTTTSVSEMPSPRRSPSISLVPEPESSQDSTLVPSQDSEPSGYAASVRHALKAVISYTTGYSSDTDVSPSSSQSSTWKGKAKEIFSS